MLPAKPSPKEVLTSKNAGENAGVAVSQPRLFPNPTGESAGPQIPSPDLNRAKKASATPRKEKAFASFQTRVPVIIGEATYTGMMPVDGVLLGQLGAAGGNLGVRQKSRTTLLTSGPELNGELIFKDMLRVNGHIAGQVCSQKGTLIVDSMARVDANVDVAVAVIGGTVNGDIVAHQRVELGPEARINGNIWTQSIAIQPGAIFEGVCRMLQNEEPQV
jgi:cytoskeletal protein CcmA (bactofilin family)